MVTEPLSGQAMYLVPDWATSLDAEVEHEDEYGKYWYFRYSCKGRWRELETMFGDVAIAVESKMM